MFANMTAKQQPKFKSGSFNCLDFAATNTVQFYWFTREFVLSQKLKKYNTIFALFPYKNVKLNKLAVHFLLVFLLVIESVCVKVTTKYISFSCSAAASLKSYDKAQRKAQYGTFNI